MLQSPRSRERESDEGIWVVMMQLLKPDSKGKWVEKHLGPQLAARSGPAGLRNLGATCYVSFLRAPFLS